MKSAEKAAEKWMELYSSPGEFEESGQQEAFFAGWKAAGEYVSKMVKINMDTTPQEDNYFKGMTNGIIAARDSVLARWKK